MNQADSILMFHLVSPGLLHSRQQRRKAQSTGKSGDKQSKPSSRMSSLPLHPPRGACSRNRIFPDATAERRRGEASRSALQGLVHDCDWHSAGERTSQLARYGMRFIFALCTSPLTFLLYCLALLILINYCNN